MTWVIVLVYLAAFIAIGIYASVLTNRKKDSNSFLVASSSLPWWAVALSEFSYCVGGSVTIGVANNVLSTGLVATQYAFSHAFVILLAALTYGKVKKIRTNNVNEFIGESFSVRDAHICGVWQAVALIGLLGAQLLSGVSLLGLFFPGITKLQACVVCVVIYGIFAVMGGFRGSSFTNILNAFCIVIGLLLCLFFGAKYVGGIDLLKAEYAGTKYTSYWSGQPAMVTLGWWLANGLCVWGSAPEWLQFRAAKSEKHGRIGFTIAAIGAAALGVVVGYIGLMAVKIAPDATNALNAVANKCPEAVRAFTGIALFSVIASTGATYFIAVPGQFMATYKAISHRTLTQRAEFWTLKVMALIIGAIGFLVAMFATNIISVVVNVAAIGLTPIAFIVAGIWWCPKLMRKSTCTVTMIIQFIVVIIYYFVRPAWLVSTFPNVIFPCLIAIALAFVLCALFDKRPITPEHSYIEG